MIELCRNYSRDNIDQSLDSSNSSVCVLDQKEEGEILKISSFVHCQRPGGQKQKSRSGTAVFSACFTKFPKVGK